VTEFNGDPASVYNNGFVLYVGGEALSGTSDGEVPEEPVAEADALVDEQYAEEAVIEEADDSQAEDAVQEDPAEAPAEEVVSTQNEAAETAADNQSDSSTETQETSHTGVIVAVALVILCAAVIAAMVIRNKNKAE